MSATIIKTENFESEDMKPQIKEGGASGGVLENVGSKPMVKKIHSVLKVRTEGKQLKLRLKEQHTTPQVNPSIHATPTFKQQNSVKRRINSALQEFNEDNTKTKSNLKVKRSRLQSPVHHKSRPTSPTALNSLPYSSSKCGEIFVTNNAQKWTFVCTYCQKSTRDIGEFVCHLQFKHMAGLYNDHDEEDEVENSHNNQDLLNQTEDSFINQDQELLTMTQLTAKDSNTVSSIVKKDSTASKEYFDCANYLDVNVHTDADETTPNNNNNKTKNRTKPTVTKKKKSKTKDSKNHHSRKNSSKYVVDLVEDDDDDVDNGYGKETTNKSSYQSAENLNYEMEDDEDGVQIVEDDSGNHNGNDNDEVEDDHLAFLKSDNRKEATVDEDDGGGDDGKTGIRKYRSHVRGKAYCNLCDKTFQYYSLYRNHMIKHSNITPYKCEYCSKAFKSKQAIRYHMNTHTKEVQYTCPLCPTTYGTENQFITHVLIHESETCFPCMVCAKILKTDRERDQHLETHSEERPFGCEFCNKRFRQKHHLSNHLKLHCQYRCDFCKEEFASTQTQRRPYACPSCEDYPHIRIQVERQRSKSLSNQDVNPLEIPNENMPQQQDTECVDLAEISDDEDSETSASPNDPKRVTCQYCARSYKQTSALNYHIRQKHPHLWNKMK